MSHLHSGRSVIVAWCFVVVSSGLAAGWSIEHPEYLSMSPMVLGMIVSTTFIGLPLAVGLVAVQAPAFDRSLLRSGSRRRAWMSSVIANAAYAAALTPLLMALTLLLGNVVTVPIAIWAAFLLVTCSLVTSTIWLTFNELFSKVGDA